MNALSGLGMRFTGFNAGAGNSPLLPTVPAASVGLATYGNTPDVSTAVDSISPKALYSILGAPKPLHPTSDNIWSDVWVQPYRGPLDGIDPYGMETPQMRFKYRTQYREVAVVRAAVRGKADDISTLEPVVQPADKDDPISRMSAEFVDYTVRLSPRGWRGLVDQIYTPASIDGWSLCEKKLKIQRWKGRSMWGLAHIRNLDTAYLRLQLDQYRNVLSVVNMIRGLEYYEPDDVILYSHNPMYSNPFGQSDMRACTVAADMLHDVYLIWFVALKVYGTPYMTGKAANPTQMAQLEEALKALRGGGYCVTGPDDSIEVLNLAAAAATDGFEKLIQTRREDVFYAIRYAALPFMEGDARSGSHGDTEVEQGTSDAGEKGSSLDVADCINQQLIPWIVRPNFGDIDMPMVRFGGTNWNHTEKLLNIVEKAQKCGLEVSAEWLHVASSIQPPEDPNDVLKPVPEVKETVEAGLPGGMPKPGQPPPAGGIQPKPGEVEKVQAKEDFTSEGGGSVSRLDPKQVARCLAEMMGEVAA